MTAKQGPLRQANVVGGCILYTSHFPSIGRQHGRLTAAVLCCPPATHPKPKQAVIGAGPCGLAVARELLREGHSVTVFEAGSGVGGAWLFDAAATDSDLLGLQDNRARVHSSM
jgi:NADPH-dependent 2,4-dienoyl-CoA reductase/sulfur reductase-like enzyme